MRCLTLKPIKKMKKFLMIAIAALALAACGEKNKYDAALDKYETLIDKTIEAIKEGDQKAAESLDKQLEEIAPTIQEIDSNGTDEQKERKQQLAMKFATALFGAMTPDALGNAAEDADDIFEDLGEEIDNAVEKVKDAID